MKCKVRVLLWQDKNFFCDKIKKASFEISVFLEYFLKLKADVGQIQYFL